MFIWTLEQSHWTKSAIFFLKHKCVKYNMKKKKKKKKKMQGILNILNSAWFRKILPKPYIPKKF